MVQQRSSTRVKKRAMRCPWLWAAVALSLLGGHAHGGFLRRPGAPLKDPGARVLVMKPDVTLFEMTAAGLLQPQAEWTEAAMRHVDAALREELKSRGANFLDYQPPTDPVKLHAHDQVKKLHAAVGTSIFFFSRLPTKADEFDWTLGPEVSLLREDSGARYALFISLADSYATAGRKVLAALGTVLGGTVPTGAQIGFASLVEMDKGQVVWFGMLASLTGDLRTPEDARSAVKGLLTGVPL